MLIESTVATKVADLLNGQELACQELAPLGYEGDALEQLLIQLYKAALLEIVDESDTSRVASVHFDESVLE
jgi:hypothetical protein